MGGRLHPARGPARWVAGNRLSISPIPVRHRLDCLVLCGRALSLARPPGRYTLQAAIATEHARAADPAATDWPRIVSLYEVLERAHPSPVVSLNRAAALAMAHGPERGLELIDEVVAGGRLAGYFPLHTARADLLRRAGRAAEAVAAYREALPLAANEVERAFVARRLGELGS